MHSLVLTMWQVQKHTHTHTYLYFFIVRTLNDKYISLHLTINTQPKPISNNNLKATKCYLKTSPIFHLKCVFWSTLCTKTDRERGRERTWKSGCDFSSNYSLYIFCTHTHAHKTPAFAAHCLQTLCQLLVIYPYDFSDLYIRWHVFVQHILHVLHVVYTHERFDVATLSVPCRRCV